jgi:hypothetical protein
MQAHKTLFVAVARVTVHYISCPNNCMNATELFGALCISGASALLVVVQLGRFANSARLVGRHHQAADSLDRRSRF